MARKAASYESEIPIILRLLQGRGRWLVITVRCVEIYRGGCYILHIPYGLYEVKNGDVAIRSSINLLPSTLRFGQSCAQAGCAPLQPQHRCSELQPAVG